MKKLKSPLISLIIIIASIFSYSCNWVGSNKDQSSISKKLIGCWESDMSAFTGSSDIAYFQFQSDSIVQFLSDNKLRGIWQTYSKNDTLHLAITWEDNYETDYILSDITSDSISIHDGFDVYVYKRSKDKSGNILYSNPIFKLDFKNSVDENTVSDQNYDSQPSLESEEQASENTEREIKTECYKCQGSGKQTCWDCNGKGQVKCESCHGTGITYYGGKSTCNQCNGNGMHVCRDCNGKGIDGSCSTCRGEGFIYQ